MDYCCTWITNTKVKNCFLQFKSKKVAGPDGLTPVIFKYIPGKYFEILELLTEVKHLELNQSPEE